MPNPRADKVKAVLDRFAQLKQRGIWESYWQDLAEVMRPRRADFTEQYVQGERRQRQIYDSTPQQAARGLATAIDSLIKPRTAQWFFGGSGDDDLDQVDNVKRWFETVENRMRRAVYNNRARFVQRTGEVDLDLVVLGTGALYTGEAQSREHLIFRSHHLRDTYIGENSDGQIDTVFLRRNLTARQARQAFGEEALGEKTREALRGTSGNRQDQRFMFVQAITPREDRDPRFRDNLNMPFASTVVDVESEHLISEGGFEEFPFAIPRWETVIGEVYGRSPGMVALPDANTLQQMGKTILRGGQMAVDPPVWQLDDAVIGASRMFPGGITYIDGEAAREAGQQPFGVVQLGDNIPLGREMQNDTREQIFAAFFRNVLDLPAEGPQMTATEIRARREQFLRTIGPALGQLESDYIGQIVERVFGIMLRANQFPDPPEELQGRELKFKFLSPVEQARKQTEALAATEAFQSLTPFFEQSPESFKRVNVDEMVKDAPENFGFPRRYLHSDDEFNARVQQMAEQNQAQTALQLGQQAADIASTASQIPGLGSGPEADEAA